jgi:predicted acylesterase/phospholipase RssA
MNVAKAVRLSCSIPGIYQWGVWKKKLYWDGGLMENLAINVWNNTGVRTIGILLRGLGDEPCKPWELRLLYPAMLRFAMQASERQHISKDRWKDIVVVDTEQVSPVSFRLGSEGRAKLLQAGIAGAAEFMEKDGIEPQEMDLPETVALMEIIENSKL